MYTLLSPLGKEIAAAAADTAQGYHDDEAGEYNHDDDRQHIDCTREHTHTYTKREGGELKSEKILM